MTPATPNPTQAITPNPTVKVETSAPTSPAVVTPGPTAAKIETLAPTQPPTNAVVASTPQPTSPPSAQVTQGTTPYSSVSCSGKRWYYSSSQDACTRDLESSPPSDAPLYATSSECCLGTFETSCTIRDGCTSEPTPNPTPQPSTKEPSKEPTVSFELRVAVQASSKSTCW